MDPEFLKKLLRESETKLTNATIRSKLLWNIKHWYTPDAQVPITDPQHELYIVQDGRTPLGYAAEHGILVAIDYLQTLDPEGTSNPHNLILEVVNGVPYTPLMLACYAKKTHSMRCLMKVNPAMHWHLRASNQPTNCAFRVALITSQLSLLKTAQSTVPEDVNALDPYSGISHWIYVCHQFQVNDTVFEWMLQTQGADPRAFTSDGTPLLHLAAAMYRPRRIKLLLSYGACPTTLDSRGRTAAHFLADFLDSERPDTVALPTQHVIDSLFDALWPRGPPPIETLNHRSLLVDQRSRICLRLARKRMRE